MMGRPKINDRELPPRLRMKAGNYYYVAGQKWTPLGKDLSIAKLKWAELEGHVEGETFNAALDKYLASDTFSALAENTRKSYRSAEDVLRKAFGKVRCATITPAHIYTYMDKMPSKAMANVGLNVIKGAMKQAIRAGWITINPAEHIDRHKTAVRTRYLSDDEYRKVYEHARPVMRCIMTLAYITGQRQIDILKIRLSDLTDEGIFIMAQKTAKTTAKKQLFTWTDDLRAAVDEAKAIKRNIRGLTLFCSRRGSQYKGHMISQWWRDACKAAGVEGTQFRDLRSKAGTDAVAQGKDHQQLLGHASKSMSDRYVKLATVDRVEPLKKKI